MSELQQRLLDMLKWFHAFCVEHNLRYYALGGTLLGAVRHKGFIPWDDDIDVGMPRKDYNRFIKLMKNADGQSVFRLETPLENKDFVYR
ncbi:MAG: LicD family protein, partial [Clostridia bacterium]|nr:LicD family protein [Clostridia bacterium]